MGKNIDGLVENISRASADYSPKDPDTIDRLNRTVMACVIGPVAVGKNTVISEALRANDDFGKVVSFTTREQRAGEESDTYRFRPHNADTLQTVNRQMKEGSLVQCAVHGNTGRVYWSDKDAYTRPFMLLDTLASSVPAIKDMPFERVEQVTIVAYPQTWQGRMLKRAGEIQNKEEMKGRIAEAVSSLEWSLQQGDEMAWVVNHQGLAAQAAGDLRGLIRHTAQPEPKNRRVGEQLLQSIKMLT